MERRTQFNVGYLLFALLAIFILQQWWQQAQTIEVVPYSEFEKLLAEDRIDEVVVSEQRITGKLKSPEKSGKTVAVANLVQPDLAERLSKFGVKYTRVYESTFLRDILSWVLPALVFFGVWFLLMRRMAGQQGLGGGFMSIGKSRAKVYVEKKTGVTFNDVAGVDEAKAELQEVVEFLKDPKRYGRLGARMPKGVLLVGPPGTGKTCSRARWPARPACRSSRSRARSSSRCSSASARRGCGICSSRRARRRRRSSSSTSSTRSAVRAAPAACGGHDEKEQTLNQLLVELDGFDPSTGLVLLAATNRPEILDPALLRAGRFDRVVLVDRPDKKGRLQILQVHAKKVKLAPDVDLEKIAAITPGFSGADLANLINEAALLATRRGADAVTQADFNEAIERLIAGLEKRNRVLNEQERRVVAHHELGHALVAHGAAGQRPGAQDLDHPARRRGARLHPAASDRGPLPDDARRAGEQDVGAARRARRRGSDVRPSVHRRRQRPRQGHRDRAQHGDALRHGEGPGPRRLRG